VKGVGYFLLVVSYGVWYTATKQLLGPGGSFLYWMTGNARFGAPPVSAAAQSHQQSTQTITPHPTQPGGVGYGGPFGK
jgi:hypothetical protein